MFKKIGDFIRVKLGAEWFTWKSWLWGLAIWLVIEVVLIIGYFLKLSPGLTVIIAMILAAPIFLYWVASDWKKFHDTNFFKREK